MVNKVPQEHATINSLFSSVYWRWATRAGNGFEHFPVFIPVDGVNKCHS